MSIFKGLRGRSASVGVRRTSVLTAAVLPMLCAAALAGNNWDGGGGGSFFWSNNQNWTNDTTPVYGGLYFGYDGTNGATNTVDFNIDQNELRWDTTSVNWTTNQANNALIRLFDFGGTQARINNFSSGTVTLNTAITFAATTGANWGEINARNGNITFGASTLSVTGTGVAGVRLGETSQSQTGQIVAFNNTVAATGKYFALTGSGKVMAIGGTFASGDIFVMNNGTLDLTGTGNTVTTSAVRLGGDLNTTGTQKLGQSGTLKFSNAAGGVVFGNTINTVADNTSGTLNITSLNSGGSTNQITGSIFLDSPLSISQAANGTLRLGTIETKSQTLTLTPAANGTIRLGGVVSSPGLSANAGVTSVLANGAGTVELASASTYTGDTIVTAGKFNFADPSASLASTLRFGASSGSAPVEIGLTPAGGGVTVSSTMNPRAGTSGTLSIASQNTSGSNTLSGHIGLDHNLTISQTAGGVLNITQTRNPGSTTTGYDIKGYQLTLNSAGTTNISGTIYNSTGSGKVQSIGSGTVVMSGSNDYAGGTTITAGTLRANNAAASLGTGTTTISGGTLAGTGATGGAVIVASGGTITAGDGSQAGDQVGTLTTGNQTWNNGGAFVVKLKTATNGVSWDKLSMNMLTLAATDKGFTIQLLPTSGTLTLAAGSQWQIATFTNVVTQAALDAAVTLNYDHVIVSNGSTPRLQIGGGGTSLMLDSGGSEAAPEPTTAMLVGLSGVALLGRRNRKTA